MWHTSLLCYAISQQHKSVSNSGGVQKKFGPPTWGGPKFLDPLNEGVQEKCEQKIILQVKISQKCYWIWIGIMVWKDLGSVINMQKLETESRLSGSALRNCFVLLLQFRRNWVQYDVQRMYNYNVINDTILRWVTKKLLCTKVVQKSSCSAS